MCCEKDQKAVVIIVVLLYIFELRFIFTRWLLHDKPMDEISNIMMGEMPQPTC